ncbi:MAG: hypothetical protein RIT45_1355 [Pseudomonadota bacterium]
MFSVTIRERSGQVYTFHFDKPEIIIGRVKGNDVILPKQNISKRHTSVRSEGSVFVVEDMGSTNGTYVNGHRISDPVEVGPDDKVYLGDFVMQFFDIDEHASDEALGSGAVLADDDEPELPAEAAQPDALAGLPIRRPAPVAEDAEDAEDADSDAPLDDPFGDVSAAELGGSASADFERRSSAMAYVTGEPTATPSAVFDASPESTVAKLAEQAVSARAAIDGPQVAAADPDAAMAEVDDRMTGAVGGLLDALDPVGASSVPDLSSFGGSFTAPAPLAERAPAPDPTLPRAEGYHDALARLFGRARVQLRSQLGGDVHHLSDAEWSEIERRVSELVDAAQHGGEIGADLDPATLRRDLVYELTWLGPLESLLDDDGIERVEVDGFERIAVVRDGRREESPARFSCQAALISAVERLVVAAGAVVREGRAHAEGALADGTSVRVVWPPLAPAGPFIVLRKPRRGVATLEALAAQGWMSEEIAAALGNAVRERRSVAVVAASGEPRRAILEALAAAVPNTERMAVVERDAPIGLGQTHVMRLDAAAREAGGTGPLGIAAHLGADRVVSVGCDTRLLAEIIEQGCEGGPATLASWTAWDGADAVRRASHAVMLAAPGIPERVAYERVAMALDIVAVVSPTPEGEGRVEEVVEVEGAGDEGVALRPFGAD